MIKRLCGLGVAAVVLAFASAQPAAAAVYAGQRPVTDPLVSEAVQVGEAFWHARGVNPCPNPTVYAADSLEGSDVATGHMALERADFGGCNVWLYAPLARAADDRTLLGLTNICKIVTHALGHTAGLGHTASGIMDADMSLTTRADAPWDCREYAQAHYLWHRSRHHAAAVHACAGVYVGAPEGWRHIFSHLGVSMKTLDAKVQCRSARFVAQTVAASYQRRGLLPAHPSGPPMRCRYRNTRSGIEHASCELYDDENIVNFTVRPVG